MQTVVEILQKSKTGKDLSTVQLRGCGVKYLLTKTHDIYSTFTSNICIPKVTRKDNVTLLSVTVIKKVIGKT